MTWRGSSIVYTQSHQCTLADVFFPHFFGFCLHGHCWTLIWWDTKQWRKHFTGRINESQQFLTTQLRLIRCYPISAIIVFLYILIHIFQCQICFFVFFPFYFSCFPKSWEFRLYGICCIYPPVPFSDPPCSPMCLCAPPPPPVPSVSLCLCPPSFTFTKACPSLPQCDSVALLLSVLFYHISRQKKQWFVMLPNLYFNNSLSAHTEPLHWSVPTQHFSMATKQCNTQAKHSL